MNIPIIKAENLSVGYGGKIIIGGINISFEKGKIITIIGPNGAGKSTLLKSISRQLETLCGAVFIEGENLDLIKRNELARKISLLMTSRTDTELMTCEDVIASGRFPYTGRFGFLSANDKEIVRNAMILTSTECLAECDFDKISDGQRQRVMLARAICQEPDILILDEPTSYLDIHHKLDFLGIISRLVRENGISVVMSLHELDLAMRVSDEIICVNENGIDKVGTPEEIFSNGFIERLYHIESGSFNTVSGTAELKRNEGSPKIFVIGGNGSGCNAYRRLQRANIPFAAGVIHENDIDFPIAKALAAKVVSEKAFESISAENERAAEEIIEGCGRVICCTELFGTSNKANERLKFYAGQLGKLYSEESVFNDTDILR
ncbi:MAG: ABC transporter ATP-binding protein [Oscillospiraceae bacterium]|nr:ABC transporter ATP-binding protein [Oscillospiraceae bacterium]